MYTYWDGRNIKICRDRDPFLVGMETSLASKLKERREQNETYQIQFEKGERGIKE
jgi:hypothetical protein